MKSWPGTGQKKALKPKLQGFEIKSRQRPTLPLPLESSTIGAGGLNDRVRNGNGCCPSAIAAGKTITLTNSRPEWSGQPKDQDRQLVR